MSDLPMPDPLPMRGQDVVKVEHPIFIGWIALVTQLPIHLFLTFWAGGFFGALTRNAMGLQGHAPFIVCGLVAFIGIPCVAVVGKKLTYSTTEYRFYKDRLEFEEGFFSRSRKVIAYRDIRETSLRSGLLQRTCGLGTIYLATLATGSSTQANPFQTFGFGNVSASGVAVKDVPDPDVAFEQVRALIDRDRMQV